MHEAQLLEILKRITINAHTTRSMMEDGKFIHAHRKNDAVIDQLSLLMKTITVSMSVHDSDQSQASV